MLTSFASISISVESSRNMECDEPIEVTPGMPNLRSDLSPAPLLQPMVHAEVCLTRSSTASRETICQAVETFLRAKSGTCNLPAQLESVDFGDSDSSSRAFLQGNIVSISVHFFYFILI